MKQKAESFIKNNKFMLIFLVVLLVVHFLLPLNWADDAVFLSKTADKDIFTFLNGSARPFTDAFTYIFSRNQWLWRIINPFVIITLFYAICRTLSADIYNKSIRTIALTAVFPTMVLVDAGFIATTLNYLWPVTFGILNLIPLVDYFNNRMPNKFLLFALIPLLIYTTNMQQMCAVLLLVFAVSFSYFAFSKKFKPYLLLQLFITSAGAVSSLILNFTGDNSRIMRETGRYFPAFSELNFFEKAELGFSSTFYCMTMEIRQAFVGFIIFAIFLAVMIFKERKNLFSKIISLIPIAFSAVFGIYSIIPDSNCSLTGGLTHYRMNKAVYHFEFVPDILFIIIMAIIIYSIYILIENKHQKLIAVSIFILGLGSRMIMGFSPTVWASGYRTFCIMFITFVYIAIIIITRNNENNAVKQQRLHL